MSDNLTIFLGGFISGFLILLAISYRWRRDALYWRRRARYLSAFEHAFWEGRTCKDFEQAVAKELTKSNGKVTHVLQ